MDYKKDSRLQIILVCVVLALLLAWYVLPMWHKSTLTPTAAPSPAEAPAKPTPRDEPK
jgi:flagellar basal body-associated protein FliL